MLTAWRYRKGDVERLEDPTVISDCLSEPGTLIWVDVVDATEEDLACIAEEFSLNAYAMEDARNHSQRTKLERYPTHGFVVASSVDLAEVDLFIGKDWLVSVRGPAPGDGKPWDPRRAKQRFEHDSLNHPTVCRLVTTILDDLVDNYIDRLEQTGQQIEGIEDEIFAEPARRGRRARAARAGTGNPDLQRRLLALRKELLHLRRALAPLGDVVAALLREEIIPVDGQTRLALQDVHDHVLRVVDMIDSQQQYLASASDALLAVLSHRANLVMKKMTSWGAILFAGTLIAGIYGMNFRHMPELDWKTGYPMALGLMALVTGILYVTFKRRDWL